MAGWVAGLASVALNGADAVTAHWSFQPVRAPAIPVVRDGAWCRTSVDRFVLARMEAEGTKPAAEAGRRAWLRRVTLDLTGLPPTADEADAFEQDMAPEAHERVVERLLASEAYGERWGRHWLDVARYADTAGETADYPVPVAWRYRDYVIRAFNADKPYDAFVREQVAGDILALQGDPALHGERVAATGFLAVSRRFGFDSENYHHLTLQDAIDTIGQGVLGLTLGCARCHAHKYDPVPLSDYYALYGILESTRFAFPGSEQKQRVRSMASVAPPAEALPKWRAHAWRVSELSRRLEALGKPGPSAVLRPVEGMDGDLEMQAPAAGGSKGVLVPPWVYEGLIAVTTDAQSPFRNVHPSGRVGASVAAGTNAWWMEQAVSPAVKSLLASTGRWWVQLDFKAGTDAAEAGAGGHRAWLGLSRDAALVEVRFNGDRAWLRGNSGEVSEVALPEPGQWHNVQVEVDVASGMARATVGVPGQTRELGRVRVHGTAAALDGLRVGVGSASAPAPHPSLALDNVEVREASFGPVTRDLPQLAWEGASPVVLRKELEALSGMDGDFELQRDGAAPVAPWHPGPNAAVKASSRAQSPWRNLYPPGVAGLRMQSGEGYNGFGQTLPRRWEASRTAVLHAGFDFHCEGDGTEPGTWRYYVGHGGGTSSALEIHFNGGGLWIRDGDERRRVTGLRPGAWHQVRVRMDLAGRRFAGVVEAADGAGGATSFEGALGKGWDGVVDYTFIDSHGHKGGIRPSVDADNLVVREESLPGREAVASGLAGAARQEKAAALRGQLAALEGQAEPLRRELERILVEGPVEMAYAVSEGTPRDARVQLRGDPDQPGDVVPRGFLKVLGGARLAQGTAASGRMDLARWLTDLSNPLTARVMANRIWQWHFGAALVATPNDFGLRGARPSDPALLDHLASEFVRMGWSVKAMHRLVVLSATYRQASHGLERSPTSAGNAGAECPEPGVQSMTGKDSGAGGGTAGWSPFARRRLAAEEVRDALLAVSGGLDRTRGGGHPFPLPTTWGYTQHGPFTAVYGHERRSVYLMTQRLQRHPFLALFDGADPNGSTAGRRTTTVPTQALYFMNDPFVHAAAGRLASRAMGAAPDDAGRVEAVYRMALGRSPTSGEREEGVRFLGDARVRGEGALASLARVMFASNEFLTVD